MASIKNLLAELDPKYIARKLSSFHLRARSRYPLKCDQVKSFEEFSWIIGDYFNFHFTTCVTGGGNLTRTEAIGRAKEIIKTEYRRQGKDIVSAYNDARDNLDVGLFGILTIIANGLRAEAVERWIRDAFDRHVAPNSWEQKVDMIKQFIAYCGPSLSSYIDTDNPERYANNYEELIRAYTRGLLETSNILDRL
jgi:hypothetical protein